MHAAYLCGDPFVVNVLKARAPHHFALDELGRSPAALTTTIPGASEITNRKDQAARTPLALGIVGQV